MIDNSGSSKLLSDGKKTEISEQTRKDIDFYYRSLGVLSKSYNPSFLYFCGVMVSVFMIGVAVGALIIKGATLG